MKRAIGFDTILMASSDLPHVVGRTLYFLPVKCQGVIRSADKDDYTIVISKKTFQWQFTFAKNNCRLQVAFKAVGADFDTYKSAFMYALNSMYVLRNTQEIKPYTEAPAMEFDVTEAYAPWALSTSRFPPLFPHTGVRDDSWRRSIWPLYEGGKLARELHWDRDPMKYPKASRVSLTTWGVTVPMGLLCNDMTPEHRDRCLKAGVMVRHVAYRSELESRLVEELR